MISVRCVVFCLVVTISSTMAQSSCTTATTGRAGTCIPITECPELKAILLNQGRTAQQTRLLQDSRCGPKATVPNVCCARAAVAATTTTTAAPRGQAGQAGQLPSKCGQMDGQSRIHGGNETGLGEYPWMALIEYESKLYGDIRPYCGGALITSKYVLTAAHCVQVDATKTGPPLQVRLGEHDTNTVVDCRLVEGGGQDCNEAPVTVLVQTSIAHPQYQPSDVRRRHDIALLRLQRAVVFTDFISPICLPIADSAAAAAATQHLFVAGWGQTESKARSTVKLDIAVLRVPDAACQRAYTGPQYGLTLWENQMCAGGEEGIDSCGGDSGGPLMLNNAKVKSWEAIGVVSFGPTDCGTKGVPGVYTKVFQYRPWIISQLKA